MKKFLILAFALCSLKSFGQIDSIVNKKADIITRSVIQEWWPLEQKNTLDAAKMFADAIAASKITALKNTIDSSTDQKIAPLWSSVIAWAIKVSQAQDSAAKYTDTKVNALKSLLDSTIRRVSQTVGTQSAYLDTLNSPGDIVSYQLFITSYNAITWDIGSAEKIVVIRNLAPTQVARDFNVMPYSVSSADKPIVSIVLINGKWVVKVTGVAGATLKWTLTKNIL